MARKPKPNKEHAPGGLYSGLGHVKPGKGGWYIWYEGEIIDGPYMNHGEAKAVKEWYGEAYKSYYPNKQLLTIGGENEFRKN